MKFKQATGKLSLVFFIKLFCSLISIKVLQMNPKKEPDYIVYDPTATTKYVHKKAPTSKSKEDSGSGDEWIDECSFQFTNMQNQKTVTLAQYDPKKEYLTVYPGVNLKGMCSNSKCIAFNKTTWIKCGFGTFSIGKIKSKSSCPCCKEKINSKTIVTFGFTKAEILVEGMKLQGENEVEYKKSFSQKLGKFTYFTEYDADKAQWTYLEVTAKEIK